MNTQTVTTKICTKCGEEKSFGEFSPEKRGKFGLNSRCKQCKSTLGLERYYIKTADKRAEKVSNYENIMNARKERKRERDRNNSGRKTDRRKERRHTDTKYRAKMCMRSVLWHAYKAYSVKGKQISTRGIISEDALNHLNSTKPIGTNYHIDHIIPISVFNVDDIEHLKLAHLPENLRWIEASENMRKRDSIDWSLIESSEVLSNIAKEIGLVKE